MNRLIDLNTILITNRTYRNQYNRVSLNQEEEVLRYGKYSYCVAKLHHKVELFQINIESRIKFNPFVTSYCLLRPEINP